MSEKHIPHLGGPCPVDAMTVVRPVYRGPADPTKGVRIIIAPAIRLDWSHDGGFADIIGYHVAGLARRAQDGEARDGWR